MNLKPFFCFYGGKWRAAPKYPKPKYDTIIEPFAGAAGYSLRYPDKNVILYDKDSVICCLWDYLINVSEEEILSLPDLSSGQTVDDLNVSNGAKYLIGFWLNKGTATPCKKPSTWMKGGTHPNSFWGGCIKKRIADQIKYIRHWNIIQSDYKNISYNQNVTWFIDPPYKHAGKHYKHGSKNINYNDLSIWCKSRNGQVIVCENYGADWLDFDSFCNIKVNPSKNGGKSSKEVIWTNKT